MPRISKTAIVKFAATAALMALLYRRVDAAAFKEAVSQMRWFPLVMFFPLCAANMAVSALRWRTLLRADGIEIPFGKLFAGYWIGSFFNFFMPSNIGGDVYRIADIAKRSGKPVNTTVSVFADRLAGFIVMSFFGTVFPLLGLRMIPEEWRWMLFLAAGIFACFIVAAFVVRTEFFIGMIPRLLPGKLRVKAERIARTAHGSFAAYAREPSVLLKCLALSAVFQTGMIAAIWCVGESLGFADAGIPFFAYCVFVPMINLLESVPWTLFGMGFRDAGYLMFFTAMNVPAPDAVAGVMSVVYVTFTLVYASFGGVLFMTRRRAATKVS